MKKVIITGADGFIGSSLVQKMIANNVAVIAVDVNFASGHLPESDLVTRIQSSADKSLVDKIPDGEYDAFYHLAWRGVNGVEKANPSIQLSNIQMAVDCADTCKKLGANKFLCAGTVSENATFSLSELDRISGGMIYGVAKHACRQIIEAYCKHIEQKFVWMQFANIYGVGNRTGNLVSYTLGELLAGKDATFGPALQPYDFIYIDDLVEAIYRIGLNVTPKVFYYIGSGSPRILKDYLIRIGELAGCVEKVCLDKRPDDGIRYSIELFDSSDLVETIGEYAITDFDEGISRTIKWLKM